MTTATWVQPVSLLKNYAAHVSTCLTRKPKGVEDRGVNIAA
jgi:hypothetical protein